MSTPRWIGLLLIFYVVFLVLTAPARLASRLLPPQAEGEGYLGTVWNGRIERFRYGTLAMGPVRWTLRPLSLLVGCLSARLQAEVTGGRLEASISHCLSGTTEVERLQGEIPAALLTQVAGRDEVALGGRFRPEIERVLVVDAWPVVLEGALHWRGASLLAPTSLRLGDLVARLSVRGGRVFVDLDDESGPLDLEGELVLMRDGSWHLQGTLRARGDADEALTQALALLGQPDAQGRYRFESAGRLRQP